MPRAVRADPEVELRPLVVRLEDADAAAARDGAPRDAEVVRGRAERGELPLELERRRAQHMSEPPVDHAVALELHRVDAFAVAEVDDQGRRLVAVAAVEERRLARVPADLVRLAEDPLELVAPEPEEASAVD